MRNQGKTCEICNLCMVNDRNSDANFTQTLIFSERVSSKSLQMFESNRTTFYQILLCVNHGTFLL